MVYDGLIIKSQEIEMKSLKGEFNHHAEEARQFEEDPLPGIGDIYEVCFFAMLFSNFRTYLSINDLIRKLNNAIFKEIKMVILLIIMWILNAQCYLVIEPCKY